MLVLSRKVGERVLIGETVVVTIVANRGRTVKLGVNAPASVGVFREELVSGIPSESPATTKDEKTCG